MHILDLGVAALIARGCLVVMFPFSGLDKIVHWNEALKQANSSFLPGGAVLLVVSIVVELVTPVCVVAGWHDRLAASVLAAFCMVSALLYHPFWKYAHFWSGTGEGRSHFWDFLKNFGLAGGLLLVVAGSPAPAAAVFLPASRSSAPYAASVATDRTTR